MSKDRTKQLLAESLLALTNIKPLSAVSISDITDFCSVSRSAFYYHFKDKQELIYWIYAAFHESKIRLSAEYIRDNMTELFTYMQQYSNFFKQAFSESGQNCFKEEYAKSMYQDYLHIIEAQNIGSAPDMNDFVARFFANATVETTERFLSVPADELDKYVNYLSMILKTNLSVPFAGDEENAGDEPAVFYKQKIS